MFNKFHRNQFPAWGNFLTKFPNYSQTALTLWNPASQGRLLVGHTGQPQFSYQGNRPAVQSAMFDAGRPGSCKHVYFCCLLFSFSTRGMPSKSGHTSSSEITEKLSTVNSLDHFVVSGPLCTLTIYREPQRTFIYTDYSNWYLLY